MAKHRSKIDLINGIAKDYYGKPQTKLTKEVVDGIFSSYDLKRLESYASNIIDHHGVIDTVPSLARLVFVQGYSDTFSFSAAQACILLGIGLQFKTLEECAKELTIETNQAMALFHKTMRKFSRVFRDLEEAGELAQLPSADPETKAKLDKMVPTPMSLEEELDGVAKEASKSLKEKQENFLDSIVNPEFMIKGDNDVWKASTAGLHDKIPNIVSIKRKRSDVEPTQIEDISNKKKRADEKKSKQKEKRHSEKRSHRSNK